MAGTGIIPAHVERMIREAVASQAELIFSHIGDSHDFSCRLLDSYSHEGRPLLVVTRPERPVRMRYLRRGKHWTDGWCWDCDSSDSRPALLWVVPPANGKAGLPLRLPHWIAYPYRLDELQRRRYHRCPAEVRWSNAWSLFTTVWSFRRGSTVTPGEIR